LAIQEEIKAHQEKMKAGQDDMIAEMKVHQEGHGGGLGRKDGGQSVRVEVKIDTNQEKIDGNQEETEARAEHCNWAQHILKPCVFIWPCRIGCMMFYTVSLKERHMRRPLGQLRADLRSSSWPYGTGIN
jgi:hypothetical protein